MMHKMLIKTVILLSVFSFEAGYASSSFSVPYYGDAFYNSLNAGVADGDLARELKRVLRAIHVPVVGQNDLVVSACKGRPGCYFHRSVGYTQARRVLMGKFYLTNVSGQYAVRDVYCQREYKESEFDSNEKPGPYRIPDNRILNAEHTWPQSRFN